ncbi:MAG: FAD-binding oxidoreductase [Alphaproteobacteria bacterium]|nr:MAG: FAD-binding oxidoreductase [Alphaproteobacteria bacterium]
MARTADAVIIGAGVIGAAIGLELARRGLRVLNIDKGPAPGTGSTGASCAIIRVHYSTLDGTAVAWDSYHDWARWRDWLEAPPGEELARFNECGCLVMKTPLNGMLEKVAGHSATLGIPHEHWDGAAIRARLPIYDLTSYAPPRRIDDPDFGKPAGGEIEGGVFWPTAGWISDPALATANLVRAAARHGGEAEFRREVTEILTHGGRVMGVRLDDGSEVHTPVVVNVAGPASHRVNAMAGVTEDMRITTRPLRVEVCKVPSPPGFDFERDGIVVSDSDIGCYVRPETGGILIGSEDPPCDPREFVDERDFNRGFTDQWTNQVHRYALRVPSLPIPSRASGVVDLYDVTEDWIPIYDRSSLPGFYMACGTSGNQFKNAPGVGRMMAALIEACESGHDHDAEPLEVELPNIGRKISMGFFSRRREVNPESSGSVLG